ncbi:A24 family peptidase [Chitinasiproducens palmae]|uniref:Prepilin peptidase CpaA n=1 Tax=Chitinasiproducens palmae TaxID=1770053 RepID=A0A1H2PV71_9BURK|nr:prepilin peptidase [Chitinasiproducens palmae]SDV51166.1 prepilin peptidase CpaA [Chitinasiproducens palmae]
MNALVLLIVCVPFVAYDLIARRVPNRLVLIVALAQGVLLSLGRVPPGWGAALAGFSAAAALMLPLYAVRLLGAGDVKFAALLGLLIGPVPLLVAWLLANLAAGAHALLHYASARYGTVGWLGASLGQRQWWHRVQSARQGREGIPYAAYMALAACVAVRYLPLAS